MARQLFDWCVDAQPTQDTNFAVKNVKFGDGYEQDSTIGINNVSANWSCSLTGYYNEVQAAYLFLVERRGFLPFDFDINGDIGAYKTVGAIQKTHVSGNVWRISFNVKQLFLP